MTNLANFLHDVGEGQAAIEVVANGEAVSIFNIRCFVAGGNAGGNSCGTGTTRGTPKEKMEQLAARGVNFIACRNALKGQSIPEDSLPGFITVVACWYNGDCQKAGRGICLHQILITGA
ncbi:hypothetical protein SDD30_11595 [Moorella naiadis]